MTATLTSIPVAPRLAEDAVPRERADEGQGFHLPAEFSLVGGFTVPGCFADAKPEARELLRQCHNRVRRGDRAAVFDLLKVNPEFIAVPWVRERALRLLEAGLSGRRRGRPHGTFKVNPLVIYGLVRGLIETGRAKNPEQAFEELEKIGWLTYYNAKRLFYQAQSEKRFRPVLIACGEPAESSPEEYEAVLRRGRILERGDEIPLDPKEVPGLGPVRVTLRGGDKIRGSRSRAYFELRRITPAWQGGDEVPGLRRASSRRER